MLATTEIKRPKSSVKAKLIEKIFLEDDILKIEYRNTNGGHDDLVFTNPNHPDLFDIETFLLNVVPDYKSKRLNEKLLSNFGKSIYNQLIKIADPDYMGFGKMRSIRFGRFVVEQAFEGVQKLKN